MAKTVFVLGAGSSHVTGAPLMNEFIDLADDLRMAPSTKVHKPSFDLVFDLIQNRLPRLHAKTVVNLSNVESVYSLIEMGRLVGRLPGTPQTEIEDLSRAMRVFLAETIVHSCQFACTNDGWQPPAPHASLAQFCEGERRRSERAVAIISFNWDIAIDIALAKEALTIDYGLDNAVPVGAVPLLKLHGSVNWTRCTMCNAVVAAPAASLLRNPPPVAQWQSVREAL